MAANIGLNEGMVRASKTVLNNLLSDHFVLLAKTWNYHWNVKGVSFHSYHVFMEDLYNGLIEIKANGTFSPNPAVQNFRAQIFFSQLANKLVH